MDKPSRPSRVRQRLDPLYSVHFFNSSSDGQPLMLTVTHGTTLTLPSPPKLSRVMPVWSSPLCDKTHPSPSSPSYPQLRSRRQNTSPVPIPPSLLETFVPTWWVLSPCRPSRRTVRTASR